MSLVSKCIALLSVGVIRSVARYVARTHPDVGIIIFVSPTMLLLMCREPSTLYYIGIINTIILVVTML